METKFSYQDVVSITDPDCFYFEAEGAVIQNSSNYYTVRLWCFDETTLDATFHENQLELVELSN